MIETTPISFLGRLVGPRPADLYDAWLFAAGDATLALAAWRSATGERGDAYATYVAALDREEQAAIRFGMRMRGGHA
jgi:hypothetical protein